MRIFHASNASPNATFESSLWRHNLCTPLIDMGHDVVEFDYDLREVFLNLDPSDLTQRRFIETTRPRTTIELLRQIRAAQARKPIDLFFSYFYDACVLPEAIDEIRSMGIVTVNWYCNASYQLHLVSDIAPRYDWCLVPEKFRMADYIALGARPIYCQMAANPSIYKPYPERAEFDVTFVGQAYGERPAYIRRLLDEGIDVRVWGPGWIEPPRSAAGGSFRTLAAGGARALLSPRRWAGALRKLGRMVSDPDARAAFRRDTAAIPPHVAGGTLSDLEMVRMYSRSKVNLGFSSVGDTHRSGERIVQVRLRDFEIPMSGGFYMVEDMEELEEFYEIGKEVVCYRDQDDLVEKIRYYLGNGSLREAIRRAGRERALRDHTWQRRFDSAFRTMGLVH